MFTIPSFQEIWISWSHLLRHFQPVLAVWSELANLSKRHNCSCSFNRSLMSLWRVSPLWRIALKPSTDLPSWPTTTLRWALAPLWPYYWPSTSAERLFNPLNGLVTCSPPINLALLQQLRVLCPLPFIHLLGMTLQREGEFPKNNLHGGFLDQHHIWPQQCRGDSLWELPPPGQLFILQFVPLLAGKKRWSWQLLWSSSQPWWKACFSLLSEDACSISMQMVFEINSESNRQASSRCRATCSPYMLLVLMTLKAD